MFGEMMDENEIKDWNKMNKRWLIVCLFEIVVFSIIGFCIGVKFNTP